MGTDAGVGDFTAPFITFPQSLAWWCVLPRCGNQFKLRLSDLSLPTLNQSPKIRFPWLVRSWPGECFF